MGRTTLLDAAAAYGTRAGTRTVTVTGSQFEVDVSFAGLRNALSLGEGPLADRLLISMRPANC